MGTPNLLEGGVLLILSGAGAIVWWGVRRIVFIMDDYSDALKNINNVLSEIGERLGRMEMWMNMHEKSDDERHKQVTENYSVIQKAMKNIGRI